MKTISLIARSDRLCAEGRALFGRKNLGLKAAAGVVLAIPFAAIALSMARMILAGL